MRDRKSQTPIEPQRWIRLYDAQCYRPMNVRSLANQPFHHLGANAPPLKRGIHKELCEEERIALGIALQPADIRIVKYDDSNLDRFPPLAEAGHLCCPVQIQFLKHPLYAGKIEPSTIIEVFGNRWAQNNSSCRIAFLHQAGYSTRAPGAGQ